MPAAVQVFSVRDYAATQATTAAVISNFDPERTEAEVSRRLRQIDHCMRAHTPELAPRRGARDGALWLAQPPVNSFCGRPGCGGAENRLCGEVRT